MSSPIEPIVAATGPYQTSLAIGNLYGFTPPAAAAVPLPEIQPTPQAIAPVEPVVETPRLDPLLGHTIDVFA